MSQVTSLNEIVEFNTSFKTSVNLYLSLNKIEKVLSYIPTQSSAHLIDDMMISVLNNKEQATLLVGPYGKGKSHLLLVLLAILSLERNQENELVINQLISKFQTIDEIGEKVASEIIDIWENKGRFLPVIISDSQGDLNQSFLVALNDALKRDKLEELVPDTYYTVALKRLNDWEALYHDTYVQFKKALKEYNISVADMKADLSQCSKKALGIFSEIYPKITAGSEFNPLAVSEVQPLYKSISEKLVEDFGYSGIYIVFDEFSKFIEGQNGIASGNNMKLLQDICELATDSQNAQLYITMVAHKSIKEYGKYLSKEIINSFTGIEGRIIEKFFVTSSKNNYELIRHAISKDEKDLSLIPQYEKLVGKSALSRYYSLPAFRSNFSELDFENIILKGCFPMNPLSAYLLLNISEKVAQNERTLFTFISNDEPNSMARFVAEHTRDKSWVIGADLVYDYFSGLFKKDVINEFVHNLWLGAEYALSKCESDEQRRLIKALAIILITNKQDEIPADENYLLLAVSNEIDPSVINQLVEKQLIYKKSSTNTFVFKTRAGSELKAEIKKQREIKGENVNYSNALRSVSGKYYIIPRRYNAIHMMTRFFSHEYLSVTDFLNINSADVFFNNDNNSDGLVLTLYSFETFKQEDVRKHFDELGCEKLVVVCPRKTIKVKKELKDFEIIQEIRSNANFNNSNEILKKELPLLEEDITKIIEEALQSTYEEDKDCKNFVYRNQSVICEKKGNVEDSVNNCCEALYSYTPEINNEIINRSVIATAQTKKARLNIINAILEHSDNEDFYSGTNQEATIYRSLFIRTGLFNEDNKSNISEIVKRIHSFVDSCGDKKRLMYDLVQELTSAPYGMRKGVLPIYLAYVLSHRQEDIVVYFANSEVALSAEIIVNMVEQERDYSLFVSKESLQKEKYIGNLNDLFDVADNRNLTDNRIKDIVICMQRWFRALPLVTRNVNNKGDYDVDDFTWACMMKVKKHLQKVEFNPYEILFISLPEAFDKVSDLNASYEIVYACKNAFDNYYDWLLQKTIDAIYDVYDKRRKNDLFHTMKEWYDNQSENSKKSLQNSRITLYMSCIEKLSVYSDCDVAKKLVKAVSDIYIENWSGDALDDFVESLRNLKSEIESIKDEESAGQLKLSFTGKKGTVIERNYEYVDESTGSVLRNIIEDTLDEYDDLSVNDRVGILLEMIEKIIG